MKLSIFTALLFVATAAAAPAAYISNDRDWKRVPTGELDAARRSPPNHDWRRADPDHGTDWKRDQA
ncbi:hypothetical protein K488DRAFT_86576 [Vararia minispora EC-137]|uniref:Uncharacterized protein n=1 Tax=Vararia minispora EC-137 TaxID=1314806 RepID=A0ACB8QIM7_9AGAM|nr:hypothetical protein K488DRAFT_86576 [Vararia minispora EC-137]